MPELRRIPLALLPTPIHRLDQLSMELGLDLWIKRDDLTGFALGGNKGRKLEYLLPAALERGADTIVTCGAIQSNFIRQLGAACRRVGLRCVAAVMNLPYEDALPEAPMLESHGGNVLLDELLGVELHRMPNGTWDELYDAAEALAKSEEKKGRRVYRIPVGGSSGLGAAAFVFAGQEVIQQSPSFDWIVTASSSGSTQTGLTIAMQSTQTKVLGICSDPEPELVDHFAELSQDVATETGWDCALPASAFHLNTSYVGPGYGVPSPEGNAALRRVAQSEGVFLDPIYSAKAFAGLIDLAQKGEISGRVLFWHTGGIPTLFSAPGLLG